MKRTFNCAALLAVMLCSMAVAETAVDMLKRDTLVGNYYASMVPEGFEGQYQHLVREQRIKPSL